MRPWILSGLACVALFGGTVRARIIQSRTVTTAPGSEIIRLAFIFSAPGYDEFMRCTSVPAGDSVVNRVSKEEFVECEHKGHVQYGDNPGSPAPR